MGTEVVHIPHMVFSFTLHTLATSPTGCSTLAGVLRLLRRGVLDHGQMEWEPTATQQRQPLVDEELMTVAPPHPAGEQVIRPLWAGFGPSQGTAAAETLSHPREAQHLLPEPLSRSIKMHFSVRKSAPKHVHLIFPASVCATERRVRGLRPLNPCIFTPHCLICTLHMDAVHQVT